MYVFIREGTMKRIRLRLAGVEVRFANRDKALDQLKELAEKGTYPVYIIYGPEGCGKTAWLKQATPLLREYGYEVAFVNPLAEYPQERLSVTDGIRELIKEIPGPIGSTLKLIEIAVELLYNAVRRRITKRIALLADDLFQAVGLDRAEQLVKSLLNMIEYPPVDYERIVVIVTSSEGITRERIGRHRWATLKIMWNMSKEGFRELYDQIPGEKPDFEDIWRLTGGNPGTLAELYKTDWRSDNLVNEIIERKAITPKFISRWRKWLEQAVRDPDILWGPEVPEDLISQLIEKNLTVYLLPQRDQWFWIDMPPPEKDPELGIGRYVAWQTPLHREAVKRALAYSYS
jgi:hypothetical protein